MALKHMPGYYSYIIAGNKSVRISLGEIRSPK
jgi:hypothetical protein